MGDPLWIQNELIDQFIKLLIYLLFFFQVNFWILGVKDGKAYLSVRAPFEFKPLESLKLHIGQRIGGIISAIHKDSIDIKNKRGLIVGKIPCNHISTSMSLCSTLLSKSVKYLYCKIISVCFSETFKVGDVIDELICIDNRTIPCLLSRKEAISITRTSKIKIKKLENLKKGNLIRCFFVSKTKTGIFVKPLLVDYAETILIDSKVRIYTYYYKVTSLLLSFLCFFGLPIQPEPTSFPDF